MAIKKIKINKKIKSLLKKTLPLTEKLRVTKDEKKITREKKIFNKKIKTHEKNLNKRLLTRFNCSSGNLLITDPVPDWKKMHEPNEVLFSNNDWTRDVGTNINRILPGVWYIYGFTNKEGKIEKIILKSTSLMIIQ